MGKKQERAHDKPRNMSAILPTDPNAKIISRDIVTGDEKGYTDAEKASRAANIAAASMKRTFLDKPRQLYGLHWRTAGNPFWQPPSGFIFDPTAIVVTITGYVRAVKWPYDPHGADTYRVYESAGEAAKLLNVDAHSLRENIDKPHPYGGYVWTSVPDHSAGAFSDNWVMPADYVLPVRDASASVPHTIVINDTKPKLFVGAMNRKGRSNGCVISRDLVTGQETVYRSMEAVKNELDINAHTLANTLLDKPRQAFGRHWRTEYATRFWNPPAYFKYNPASYANKTSGYIMTTDASGNKTIYEGVSEAAELSDVSLSGVKTGLKTGKCRGLTWTRLTEDDVQFWTPCLQVD